MLEYYNITILQYYPIILSQYCNIFKNASILLKIQKYIFTRKCCYFLPPEAQEWRGPLLRELIKIRDGQLEAQNLDMEETNLMIDHLCLS